MIIFYAWSHDLMGILHAHAGSKSDVPVTGGSSSMGDFMKMNMNLFHHLALLVLFYYIIATYAST